MDRHCVLSSIENSTSFFWSISSFCDVNAWRRRRNCLRCLLFNVKKTNILQMPRMKNRHTLGLITAGAGTKWNSGMKTRRASTYIHFWYRPITYVENTIILPHVWWEYCHYGKQTKLLLNLYCLLLKSC